MSLSSWGNFPKIQNTVHFYQRNDSSLINYINQTNTFIPYGNGRSYGDSALASNIVHTRPHNYFIHFDEKAGLLHVESGVLLSEILEAFVPRGWFLKITPGTKLITIAGAIASDVHGKNHHIEGCFSECIKEFDIMLEDGQIVTCSKERTPELFHASCGGMGLTGIILNAKIYLKAINSSHIEQTTIKTQNLKETFAAFEEYQSSAYSVAWIDCLAKSEDIGRCLLMVGDFSNDGQLDYSSSTTLSISFQFPSWVLNNWSVRAFNWLYYHKVTQAISNQKVGINAFFYPLDAINHWNRIYGKKGFVQYQFILPKESSYSGLKEILQVISDSGKGSFLAVLKLYGKANDNWLSFPMEGYSLALDFKIEPGLFELLDSLDTIVVNYKGRIYLAKDARVSQAVFEQGYPDIDNFREFRKAHKMDQSFQSLQSERLAL